MNHDIAPATGRWTVWLRGFLALGALALVIYKAGPAEILATVEGLSLPWVAAAVLATLAGAAARIVNWRDLIRHLVPDGVAPLGRVAYCYFAGGLIGSAVPSTAGTDAVRCILAARSFGGNISRFAAAAVVMSGLTFLTSSLLAVASFGFLQQKYAGLRMLQGAALLFTILAAGLICAYLLLHFNRAVLLWLFRLVPRWAFRLRRPLREFADALRIFDRADARLLPLLGASVVANLAVTGAHVAAATAVGVQLDFAVWLMIVPMAAIAAFIPASVSGFGISQAVMIYLLAPFGVHASHAFAVSAVTALAWLAIYSTIGAGALIAGRKAASRSPDACQTELPNEP